MTDNTHATSVDSAIRRGRVWVMYPSMALLIVPILAMLVAMQWLGEDQVPWWVWASGLSGAFFSSWLWWSVTLPRWRAWAVERTDNLGDLLLRALGAQLMWAPGNVFERTEIQSEALRLRLQRALRRALTAYAESHPRDEPALREFVDPWLYPGRRRSTVVGGGSAAFFALVLGVASLVIVTGGTVTHFLYGSPVSWAGTAGVTATGLVLTMIGRRARSDRFIVNFFLAFLSLNLSSAVLRSYPWRPPELATLAVALSLGAVGYLGLRAMARR